MEKLRHKDTWTGAYKGVYFEIVKHKEVEDEDCWNYYLYIHLGKIPEESKPDSFWLIPERSKLTEVSIERVGYSYYKAGLSNIEMHGGITYYSKESNEDALPSERVIKIGCDYRHYYDMGRTYTLEYVLNEVHESIDSFKELVPGYKWVCCYYGSFHDISEGMFTKSGEFISYKGIEKRGWNISELTKEQVVL